MQPFSDCREDVCDTIASEYNLFVQDFDNTQLQMNSPLTLSQIYSLVLNLLRQKYSLECSLNTLRHIPNKDYSLRQLEMTIATSLAQHGQQIDSWADGLTQEIAEVESPTA
jgi:hypothetical protein